MIYLKEMKTAKIPEMRLNYPLKKVELAYLVMFPATLSG